jgi:hypothetical protein
VCVCPRFEVSLKTCKNSIQDLSPSELKKLIAYSHVFFSFSFSFSMKIAKLVYVINLNYELFLLVLKLI